MYRAFNHTMLEQPYMHFHTLFGCWYFLYLIVLKPEHKDCQWETTRVNLEVADVYEPVGSYRDVFQL